MAPTRLRRRMSCFTRTTVKFVASAFASGASPVCMFSAPMLKLPTLPVSRPPPTMGTVRPACRPMRRLKKTSGASLPARVPGGPCSRPPLLAPKPVPSTLGPAPKSKMPRASRKNSRFSGKNRLKRVRFTCCSSTSTCAKSVL